MAVVVGRATMEVGMAVAVRTAVEAREASAPKPAPQEELVEVVHLEADSAAETSQVVLGPKEAAVVREQAAVGKARRWAAARSA